MDRIQECDIELACQKVVRDYYYHVDRREFEKAVELFTPDVDCLPIRLSPTPTICSVHPFS